mgnify:CR=1 FL=1
MDKVLLIDDEVDVQYSFRRIFASPELVAALGDPPVVIDDDTVVVCETFRLAEIVG